MPYFIFERHSLGMARLLESHEQFAPASQRAKALRSTGMLEPGCSIKVMFAQTAFEAEDQLCQVRPPPEDASPDD